eukprot:TRINITY_DN67286_c7_g1_i1.p1 TRINITY_DN67286_c7_g1~~TRINITY_DN67286_c7_g1_i1.p1  ORF type:complete len:743 (+),score=360.85 TRINITY_DN67286_c7_g1_i1:38-2230(+)
MGCTQTREQNAALSILEKTPFAYRMTADELETFANYFDVVKYREGELITSVDEEAEFFVVGSGRVSIKYNDEELCKKDVGDFFGQIAAQTASMLERKESLFRVGADTHLDERGGKKPNLGKAKLTQRESNIELARLASAHAFTRVKCAVLVSNDLDDYLKTVSPRLRDIVRLTMGSSVTKNLRQLPFLKNVPERKITVLSSLLHFVPVSNGDYLFREGDIGESLFIVYQGEVHAVAKQMDADGKVEQDEEITLRTFKEGDFLGETGLIMGMPRTASIVARADSLLLELRKDDFQNFLKLVPNLNFQEKMKTRIAEHFRKYKVPFFEAIPDEHYPFLASLCQVEQVLPGTKIFAEGDAGDTFYIIAHGEVVVTVKKRKSQENKKRLANVQGEEIELNRMGPGKYFGEIALVRECTRTATITTTKRCVILSITKANFEKFFERCPEALADFEVKLARYDVAMRSVIYHPLGLHYFTQYLEREYSDENILFWMACRDYRHFGKKRNNSLAASKSTPANLHLLFTGKTHPKELEDTGERKEDADVGGAAATASLSDVELTTEQRSELLEQARAIMERFIVQDSPDQVNIKAEHRLAVEKAVAEGTVDLNTFVHCEREILMLIEADSFGRFKQSDLFRQFLEEASSYKHQKQQPDMNLKPIEDVKLRSGSVNLGKGGTARPTSKSMAPPRRNIKPASAGGGGDGDAANSASSPSNAADDDRARAVTFAVHVDSAN